MSRSWRRRVLVLTMAATIVGAVGVAPALAAWSAGAPSSPGNVQPSFIGEGGRCSQVRSLATSQFKVNKLFLDGTYVIPGGPTITIDASSDQKTFSWTISLGWEVYDVTARASGDPFNHYDYQANGGPRTFDGALHGPLRDNVLRKLGPGFFCYSAVAVEEEPIFLSGTKFHDHDIDGVRDGSEEGISGWTITAHPAEGAPTSTQTGEGGQWSLEVPPGSYTICESPPEGSDLAQSFPDNTVCEGSYPGGHTGNFTGDTSGLNFGNYQQAVLVCGEPETITTATASASFTLLPPAAGGICEGGTKTAGLESVGAQEFVFLPIGVEQPSRFTGQLQLVKPESNPVLRYDQTVDEFDFYETVPACQNPVFGEGGGFESADIPAGHTWCIFATEVQPLTLTRVRVTFSVFGVGDPKFR